MTKRDFFILLIKIFGLQALIVSLFSILPTTISYTSFDGGLETASIVIISLGVIVLLYVLLFHYSEKVVDWLKLDKGYEDDRIDLKNFSSTNIIRLACLLLGGYLVIHNIPTILNLLFFIIKYDQEGLEFGVSNNLELGIGVLNLVIGYLLVTNHIFISKILEGKKTES